MAPAGNHGGMTTQPWDLEKTDRVMRHRARLSISLGVVIEGDVERAIANFRVDAERMFAQELGEDIRREDIHVTRTKIDQDRYQADYLARWHPDVTRALCVGGPLHLHVITIASIEAEVRAPVMAPMGEFVAAEVPLPALIGHGIHTYRLSGWLPFLRIWTFA